MTPGRTSRPSRASRSAGLCSSAARAISAAACWNRSVFATKSVSQLTSTSTPAEVPSSSAVTRPLAAVLVARLLTSLAPLSRRTSTAASKSPSVCSSAFLQSSMPAAVCSRSRFTSAAVKFAMSSSLTVWSSGGPLARGAHLPVARPDVRRRRTRTRSSRCRRRPRPSPRTAEAAAAVASASPAARSASPASRPPRPVLPRPVLPRRRAGRCLGGAGASVRRGLGGLGGRCLGRGGSAAASAVAAAAWSSAALLWRRSRSHSASGSSAPMSPDAGGADGFSSPSAAPARAMRPSATASATTRVSSATLRIASSLPGIG